MSSLKATAPHRLATVIPAWSSNRWARRLRRLAVNGTLCAAVVLFGFLAVGPHLFSYRTETMLTGSMVPVVNPGDVVVVTQEATWQVRPGQILSFQPPLADHRVVTHRVVSVTHEDGGSIVIETKGDANAARDPWRAVVPAGEIWRVRAVVPYIGEVVRLLRVDVLRFLLVWAVPVAVAGWLLNGVWRSASDIPRP